jgi:aspartyl protease family protein
MNNKNSCWSAPESRPGALMRGFRALCRALACLLACGLAQATEVNVVGLFPGKALVSINGGAPRSLAVGQKTPEGVVLVSTAGDSATFDVDGKRRSLRMGEAYRAAPSAGSGDTVILSPDSQGHYQTVGAINGRSVQFLVDTGASIIWFSADLATRLGVSWQKGETFTVQTAGGPKQAWRVLLPSVRVGGITLENVEAAVGEGAGVGDTVLLGQTFLSRLSMMRDGNRLILSRKEGAGGKDDGRPRVVLKDIRSGLFATTVKINGTELPFVVDTGATMVSIDAGMAQRLGIRYQTGTPGVSQTANGLIRVWRVKLDSVSVGPITLYGVDGSVREGGDLGVGLLGMSFLNRLEMHRDGEAMTLIKRY